MSITGVCWTQLWYVKNFNSDKAMVPLEGQDKYKAGGQGDFVKVIVISLVYCLVQIPNITPTTFQLSVCDTTTDNEGRIFLLDSS